MTPNQPLASPVSGVRKGFGHASAKRNIVVAKSKITTEGHYW
jgi:hypothetical protein